MMKIFPIIFIAMLLVGCSNYGQLTYVTKLPKSLKETSGIAYYGNNTAWFIEDHGNKDNIYNVNFKGEILKKIEIKNAKNKDWEDLAKDDKGNLYIADTGNNSNKRDDLVIYKIKNPELTKGDTSEAEKIKFNYPEQKDFPPKKKKLFYDAEAIFYNNNFIYIITKDRSKPFKGKAFIYKVPAKKGSYEAELIGEFNPCETAGVCQVTAADISPDGKTVVLLGYGLLWLFTDFDNEDFTKGTIETIALGATTQLESVCFTDNTTLLISDEERAKTGQNLYTIKIE